MWFIQDNVSEYGTPEDMNCSRRCCARCPDSTSFARTHQSYYVDIPTRVLFVGGVQMERGVAEVMLALTSCEDAKVLVD